MRLPLRWLQEFVPCELSPSELSELLTLAGIEVEAIEHDGNEAVLTLGLTPNRGDCLSIVGVAREVAALTAKRGRKNITVRPKGRGKIKDTLQVSVKAKSRSPRYLARLIRGVKVGPSPSWLQQRLSQVGIRSINNIVDATNYVMIELGQPLHAFDAAKIKGDSIIVQTMDVPRSFTTLDGGEHRLSAEDLLICDVNGPIAIAGVMGGAASAVSDATTDIVLESASFEPVGVRRTSKRLGISTDSSRRFERGVDPQGPLPSLHRVTELILELAGGTPTEDWIDLASKPLKANEVEISTEEVARLLGIPLPIATMIRLLERLGLRVLRKSSKKALFEIPSYRVDLHRSIDLIEEVARLHGYHRLPESLPVKPMMPIVRPQLARLEPTLRSMLCSSGFSEAIQLSFQSEVKQQPFLNAESDLIRLMNPLSQDQATLRTSLLPGLLDAMKINQHRSRLDARLFSLQRMYSVFSGQVQERLCLAGVMSGRRFHEAWERANEKIDFYDVKGVVENIIEISGKNASVAFHPRTKTSSILHPTVALEVHLHEQCCGYFGEAHPKLLELFDLSGPVFVFHLELEKFLQGNVLPRFQELSRFPFVERDLSFLVDENISAKDMLESIRRIAPALMKNVAVFDVYKGKGMVPGKKSLALRVTYASDERTLDHEEVEKTHHMVVSALEKAFHIEVRK